MASVPNDYVYLDYAATAPLCEEAAEAMAPYQVPGRANLAVGGNANSLHGPGRAAFAALEEARRSIARDLGARRPDGIVFTSGATEADDAALLGIAQAAADERRRRGAGDFVPHVVVTAVEHDAVLAPAKRLESQGFRVTRLAPNRQGFIEERALEAALDADTVLVSVQAANSEVGSIQPIADLARVAHDHAALFHTDAVQALGKARVNLQELDVDAASFSAHKVGGPKGVGALYLRARTPFHAYAIGGGQEGGRRSGTQNVAGIVGFAAAVHAATAIGCTSGWAPSTRWRPPWTLCRAARISFRTSCMCWWTVWKAKRSSFASTCRASACRAGLPARRTRWNPATCCVPSASTPTARTAPCASRWGATPTKPMSKPSRSPWRRA